MGAGIVFDERTRLIWFPEADAPTDLEAITAAELAADGVDLSAYIPPDGINPNTTDQRVDGSDLLTGFNAESMGRYGTSPSVTFKRKLRTQHEGADDLAFTTFQTRKTAGTLVLFNTLPIGEDPGTGDDYIAWPGCESGEPQEQQTAANTEVRFVVEFAVGQAPVRGTVVAS
jgi:hypothetical protein